MLKARGDTGSLQVEVQSKLIVFDRGFLKARCAFMGTPTVTGSLKRRRSEGHAGNDVTSLLERRQGIHVISAVMFPPLGLSQRSSTASCFAAITAIAALSDGSL